MDANVNVNTQVDSNSIVLLVLGIMVAGVALILISKLART